MFGSHTWPHCKRSHLNPKLELGEKKKNTLKTDPPLLLQLFPTASCSWCAYHRAQKNRKKRGKLLSSHCYCIAVVHNLKRCTHLVCLHYRVFPSQLIISEWHLFSFGNLGLSFNSLPWHVPLYFAFFCLKTYNSS